MILLHSDTDILRHTETYLAKNKHFSSENSSFFLF